MLILTFIQQIYQLAKLAQKYHKPQRFAFLFNKRCIRYRHPATPQRKADNSTRHSITP